MQGLTAADGVLTNADLLKIKQWVAENQNNAYDAVTLALLNAPHPTHRVWRTWVPWEKMSEDTSFGWSRVDNLTVGKSRIWEWRVILPGGFNPSKANIRAAIDEVWSAVGDAATKAAVYAHCKRRCSLVEQLLATGTGTDAAPAELAAEGLLTLDELGMAEKAV